MPPDDALGESEPGALDTDDLMTTAGASASEIAALIRSRAISSVEVTERCLARIAALDSTYHAYLTVLADRALAAAARADAELLRGGALGPMHGVPVNVKDAFRIQGTATTIGSRLLQGGVDAEGDAACVERLSAAGAVILGKTNVGSEEWANPDIPRFETPRNAWNAEYTAGGSSSGSAVSVALGMGYASVGTDLGGSVRLPAALNGVVGLKPTYGLVSLRGDVYGLCRSMEHVGPLTRTVRDAALVLSVLAGYDPEDPCSAEVPMPEYVASLDRKDLAGVRVGWVSDGGPRGAAPEILDLVAGGADVLADAGAGVIEVSLPAPNESLWFEATMLEEWEAFDAAAIEPGAYREFVRARLRGARRKARARVAAELARLREAYRELFERVDLLIMPTVPATATPFGVRTVPWAGAEREVKDLQLINTWVFNVTGQPAVAVPCGFAGGLPASVQLAARHFDEPTLLAAAARLEEARGAVPLPPAAAP